MIKRDIPKLEQLATEIPTMNWQITRDMLRKCAARVESGLSIVEIGSWLGACSAAMMLGVIDSDNDVDFYIYDRFIAYQSQIEKAEVFGIKLKSEKPYQTLVNKFLRPFKVPYKLIRGDIKQAQYDGKKQIGLLVDDASKKRDAFRHTMTTFQPHFIPNKTIVALLDFFYYEKKPGKGYEFQKEWMEANKQHYKFILRIENPNGQKSSEAFFKYLG